MKFDSVVSLENRTGNKALKMDTTGDLLPLLSPLSQITDYFSTTRPPFTFQEMNGGGNPR